MGLFHYKTILEELANTKIKAPFLELSKSWNPLPAPQKVLQGDSGQNLWFSKAFITETKYLTIWCLWGVSYYKQTAESASFSRNKKNQQHIFEMATSDILIWVTL